MGIKFYYINPRYRFRYRILVRAAYFVDGIISVLSFGMVGTSLEMDSHVCGTRDYLEQRMEKTRDAGGLV